MSDQELREQVKRSDANGDYAVEICRRCHDFWTDPEGKTDTAKIVEKCNSCWHLEGDALEERKRANDSGDAGSRKW